MNNSANSLRIDQVTPFSIASRLERLPFSSWHIRILSVMGAATFFDGYDLQTMAFVLPVLTGFWKIGPKETGLILSSVFIGQLLGGFASGSLAERFGRLYVATITIGIFSVMSLVCAFAWNPQSMIIFRIIQGIGLGGEIPVVASYISEIARSKDRGRFYGVYEAMFGVGLVCAALVGYTIIPKVGWQSMFLIGGIPAALVLLIRRILPESPRWLASKGRLDEANAVVTHIEEQVVQSGRVLPPYANQQAAASAHLERTRWMEIFEGMYLRRTLTVWVLFYCCFTVSYGLVTWLPTLYRTVFHLPLSTALGYGLMTQIIGFSGALCSAFLIDKVGRRRWFAVAFFGGGISLWALWIFGATSAMAVFICASSSFFFIASISLLIHLYTAELYPTRVRAFGCGIGTVWQRLAAAIGPLIIGVMLASGGVRSVFVLFGAISLLGGAVTAIAGTESRVRQLEALSP